MNDEGEAVVVGVEEVADMISEIEPDEAKQILTEVSDAFSEIDYLKIERREKVGEVSGQIAALRGQIQKKLEDAKAGKDKRRHKVDAAKAVGVIDRHWRRMVKLEGERDQIRKDYGDKIKAAQGRLRTTLDDIRQRQLPFEDE